MVEIRVICVKEGIQILMSNFSSIISLLDTLYCDVDGNSIMIFLH